jgi:hypothetical protein
MKGNSHETFESSTPLQMGSERSFGFVVGGILLVIALWPVVRADTPHLWALIPGLPLVVLAAFRPALLAPLNRLWFGLGLLLGRIVSPVVLGIVYFAWITPFALVLRLMKKKLLDLAFDPQASSYWIARSPARIDAAARLRRPY